MGGWGLALGGVALLAVGAYLAWRMLRTPLTAEQREQRRRLTVDARGRISNATLVEVRGSLVSYRYQVGGVEYVASQDLSALSNLLPTDLTGLSGHASVKYLPENPANSIVASERWCGLHRRPAQETAPGEASGCAPTPTPSHGPAQSG